MIKKHFQARPEEHGSKKCMLQLSSGMGPVECELGVGKLLFALMDEFCDIIVLEQVQGKSHNCYRCVKIASQTDLSFLDGTVKWICQSPFRAKHKRKNWFIDISLVHQAPSIAFDTTLIRFETFRSSGKGGQHVNKVETGVRAIYTPMGLSVTATNARSQYLNKQIALNRLCSLIAQYQYECGQSAQSLNRLEHIRIERGNPVRVYEGMDFIRLK